MSGFVAGFNALKDLGALDSAVKEQQQDAKQAFGYWQREKQFARDEWGRVKKTLKRSHQDMSSVTPMKVDHTLQRGKPTPAVTETSTAVNTKIGGALTTKLFPYPEHASQTTGNYNSRDSPIILYKGIKICRWFTNIAGVPVIIHWAVIQLKQGHYWNEIGSEQGGLSAKFFRTTTDADRTDRAANFTPYTNAGGTPVEELDPLKSCAPMNPDRFYRILTRRSFKLAAKGGIAEEYGRNTKKMSKYYRINKTVHWKDTDNETAEDVEMPLVEVFWSDYWSLDDAGTKTGDLIWSRSHNTAYFRSRTTH